MVSITNIDELKNAITNKEATIEVAEIHLSRQIREFKSVSPAAIGVLVSAAMFFVAIPMVGGMCLAVTAILVGKDVIGMIRALGQNNARQLYFSYSINKPKDKTGNIVLQRK